MLIDSESVLVKPDMAAQQFEAERAKQTAGTLGAASPELVRTITENWTLANCSPLPLGEGQGVGAW